MSVSVLRNGRARALRHCDIFMRRFNAVIGESSARPREWTHSGSGTEYVAAD